MTFYWEVKKTAMDAALCEENTQQTRIFDDAQDDSSDSDLEDVPRMHVIPLEHILQGSYKDRSASKLYPWQTTVRALKNLEFQLVLQNHHHHYQLYFSRYKIKYKYSSLPFRHLGPCLLGKWVWKVTCQVGQSTCPERLCITAFSRRRQNPDRITDGITDRTTDRTTDQTMDRIADRTMDRIKEKISKFQIQYWKFETDFAE